MAETDAQGTGGPEPTQVIRERKKKDVRLIEERVREFDNHFGPDIEEGGFSAISSYTLRRLRELLSDLKPNYQVVLARGVSHIKSFPLEESRVYARSREGYIEVFSEEDLSLGGVGFFYGALRTFAELDNLRDAYKKINSRRLWPTTKLRIRNGIVRLTRWEKDTRLAYQKALGLVLHDYAQVPVSEDTAKTGPVEAGAATVAESPVEAQFTGEKLDTSSA